MLKVLLVDDHVHVRTVIMGQLEDGGVSADRVLCAGDVPSAIEALEVNKNEIVIVLTDGRYPGGGAAALIKHLRQENPDLPIIVITCAPDKWRLGHPELAASLPVFDKSCLLGCDCKESCSKDREGYLALVQRALGLEMAADTPKLQRIPGAEKAAPAPQ